MSTALFLMPGFLLMLWNLIQFPLAMLTNDSPDTII